MNSIAKISLWAGPVVILKVAAAFRRAAQESQHGESLRKYSQLALWVAVTILITLAATMPAMACPTSDC